jgi:hypothetical protein
MNIIIPFLGGKLAQVSFRKDPVSVTIKILFLEDTLIISVHSHTMKLPSSLPRSKISRGEGKAVPFPYQNFNFLCLDRVLFIEVSLLIKLLARHSTKPLDKLYYFAN